MLRVAGACPFLCLQLLPGRLHSAVASWRLAGPAVSCDALTHCHYPPTPTPPHRCRRGAACTRDRHGLTAAQLAAGRECSRDSELTALLAKHV